MLLYLPASAAILYMAGLAGFFCWEERAGTNAEFIRRMEIRNVVYAPLIWLKAHDPSGVVRAVVLWEHSLCHRKSFDPNRLTRTVSYQWSPNQQVGANGEQPLRSEAVPTSVAAAPRGSP